MAGISTLLLNSVSGKILTMKYVEHMFTYNITSWVSKADLDGSQKELEHVILENTAIFK